MADYFEIDFLGVETAKSGDAITLRYSVNGNAGVHVVVLADYKRSATNCTAQPVSFSLS